MKFILGRKKDMSQIWQSDDKVVAVTRVSIEPCTVVQVKSKEKDGYNAIQLGCGERKEKNIKKPQKGHMKGLKNFQVLREFRVDDSINLKRGDEIGASTFEAGDKIQVTAVSKGKGFQGVVKRHGFKGQPTTHGTKDQVRMPGSIGATGPAHVFKGTRMPGRMGGDRITIKNLEVVEADLDNNILSIKGAVPGPRNGLVILIGEGDLKVKNEEKKENVGENKSVDNTENANEGKSENTSKEKTDNTQENKKITNDNQEKK